MKPWRSRKFVHLCGIALLLLVSAGVRAEGTPIVVERLDRDIAQADSAEVIAGADDAQFHAEAYAAITPSRYPGVWYRLHLVPA